MRALQMPLVVLLCGVSLWAQTGEAGSRETGAVSFLNSTPCVAADTSPAASQGFEWMRRQAVQPGTCVQEVFPSSPW